MTRSLGHHATRRSWSDGRARGKDAGSSDGGTIGATEDAASRRPAGQGETALMVTQAPIEVPYAIAAALPTLSVMDITTEVSKALAGSGKQDGIAYVSATRSLSLVRVQERETGFFEDLECLLERVVPTGAESRARLVHALLGSTTEQVPFSGGSLCLGQWQRIMLFSLDAEHRNDWSLTLLG